MKQQFSSRLDRRLGLNHEHNIESSTHIIFIVELKTLRMGSDHWAIMTYYIIELTLDEFTLQPNTYYTVFIRGVTEDGHYQSTFWYTPVRLSTQVKTGK